MAQKTIKIPGPDHPITITPSGARVVVKAGGKVIVDTRRALVLRETAYGPAYYVPREDTHMDLLERSEHQSTCPYKGDASYYSILAGGARSVNAVWSYEAPYESVAQIKAYLAFYPDRVDEISVDEA